MAKKQIFKSDGTEDFDAESKELDDAAAPGLVSDDASSSSSSSGSSSGSSSSSSDSSAPSDTLGKSSAGPASSSSPSSASSSNQETSSSAPAATPSDSTELTPSTESTEAPAEPEPFGDLHGAVTALGDVLEQDALSALKEAGNKVTPAVSKLHGIEAKLEALSDEVKARFVHAKTQLVNAMGALEMLFKRGK